MHKYYYFDMSTHHSLIVAPHSWFDEDDEENGYTIYVSGRTEDGTLANIQITQYHPYVYVELSLDYTQDKAIHLFQQIQRAMKEKQPVKYQLCTRKKLQTNLSNRYIIFFFKRKSDLIHFERRVARYSNFNLKVHEHNIHPFLKYAAKLNFSFSSWIKLEGVFSMTYSPYDKSKIIVGECHYASIQPYEPTIYHPIINYIASFDIECRSVNHNSRIPDPSICENEIFQIAVTFLWSNTQEKKVYLITLFDCKPIKHATVLNCASEDKLLECFFDLLVQNIL